MKRNRTICCIAVACIMTAVLEGGCGTSQNVPEEKSTQVEETATGEAATGEAVSTLPDDTVPPAEEATVSSDPLMQTSVYKLKEVGTVEDQEKSIQMGADGIYAEDDGDTKQIYNYKGKASGRKYHEFRELEEAENCENGIDDCYIVAGAGKSPNIWGLVSSKGVELIPCEASMLEALSERYVEVVYATKETKNKKEVIIFASNSSIGTILGPDKDDTLYKGYAKIYDRKRERMVPGIKIEKSGELGTLKICGESICYQRDAGYYEMYNASGKMILTDKGKEDDMWTHNDLIKLDGKIYDDQGKMLMGYREGSEPKLVDGNNSCIVYVKNRGGKNFYTVVDKKGNVLLDGAEKKIVEINDDMICFSEIFDKHGLMTLQGEEVVPATKCTYFYCGQGYWDRTNEDGTHDLVSKEGVVAEKVDNLSPSLVCTKETDQYVVLKGNGKTLNLSEASEIATALVKAEENGYYGLVDLYTGVQLLGYEYDDIRYAAGHVYAYKGGVWTIYEVLEA